MAATDASQKGGWLPEVRAQVVAVDSAISEAVEKTETPTLDRFLVLLSDAANHSRLWIATAGAVALVGGPRGRRAATEAVASIALASGVSNLALKSMTRRRRPPRRERGGRAVAPSAASDVAVLSVRPRGVRVRVRVNDGRGSPCDLGTPAPGSLARRLCPGPLRRP
jgi:hypothetical protein